MKDGLMIYYLTAVLLTLTNTGVFAQLHCVTAVILIALEEQTIVLRIRAQLDPFAMILYKALNACVRHGNHHVHIP